MTPNSGVNKSGFEKSFADGITFRGSVEFSVTNRCPQRPSRICRLKQYHGRHRSGRSRRHLTSAPSQGTVGIKNHRFYFAYTVDQYLYQSQEESQSQKVAFSRELKIALMSFFSNKGATLPHLLKITESLAGLTLLRCVFRRNPCSSICFRYLSGFFLNSSIQPLQQK